MTLPVQINAAALRLNVAAWTGFPSLTAQGPASWGFTCLDLSAALRKPLLGDLLVNGSYFDTQTKMLWSSSSLKDLFAHSAAAARPHACMEQYHGTLELLQALGMASLINGAEHGQAFFRIHTLSHDCSHMQGILALTASSSSWSIEIVLLTLMIYQHISHGAGGCYGESYQREGQL